jgi:L-alanine-DL-glutamate epimerase-like enolase superfamily enzyme
MKITEARAIPLAIPLRVTTPPSPWAPGAGKQILVRVTTDEGLTGWGECFAYGAPEAVCNVVDDALGPLVVGHDPTQIEGLVDRMHRALMIWGRRGLAMMAVSGSSWRCGTWPARRETFRCTSCSAACASRVRASTPACCVTRRRRT